MDIQLWYVDIDIQEVWCTEVHDQCYVSTSDGGDVENYSYWEVFDHESIASVKVPYIGEEDEIRNEVLIPAIESYLRSSGYIDDNQEVEFTGDCLSYEVRDTRDNRPIYRLVLG